MLMRKISIVHTHLCQIRHMWNIYTTFELGNMCPWETLYLSLSSSSPRLLVLILRQTPGGPWGPVYIKKTCPGLKGHPPGRVIELKRGFIWEEKSDPFAQVKSARACCDCLNQRSRMLWLSRLDRLAQAWRGKVLIWRKKLVEPTRRVTLWIVPSLDKLI